MKFAIDHMNINVKDLGKSLDFYSRALGLREVSRKRHPDGLFELAFLSDESEKFKLELTWLMDKEGPYELGDNETHLALHTGDGEAARKLHAEMGCICFENKEMGIYFIEDPDGYWIEIIPRG